MSNDNRILKNRGDFKNETVLPHLPMIVKSYHNYVHR